MAASDSESSMSGVDVTITAVHPSPFRDIRDPAAGDEFDGQEISFEPPESRDIQAFLDSQLSPTTPVSSSSDTEVPELSQPAADQDDFGIHSMCSDQASSAYPAVKTPGSSPRTKGYGSPRDKTPRIQVPTPTDKLAKKPEPFAGPRLASDPRLRESSQHLETEHLIEKDAIRGAMSVKLVSWAEPLKITPNHPDVVERNARYLARLDHEANIKEPPIMEWTFLANMMQAYTGNNETLFSHAACMESKQYMFCIHYLRGPFSTKADDSVVHRYKLFFAHGTNTAGAEGMQQPH
eukprot:s1078_g8.t1